jgi:hypothetical protein
VHVLTWPKTRRLTDLSAAGRRLPRPPGAHRGGGFVVSCADPDELRAFAMQVHAAAIDRDLEVQEAAVEGVPGGPPPRPAGCWGTARSPTPEPPMHMEVPA